MNHWAEDAVFYHVYPLGACNAPARNDAGSPACPRLQALVPWLAHAHQLGATALYLGPVFESSTHGYDTVDYFRVDRRLGTDSLLATVVAEAHARGMRVVLDAVFGHVGRGFPAFAELRSRGVSSTHRDWFRGVDFNKRSPLGDPFCYDYWKDSPELPRLDLSNPAVRQHLFSAVDYWISRFQIDGLRLDSADWLDLDFLGALRDHCARVQPDFWLLGEVVHGDYRRWANPKGLDSVTNYEVYKGLWSSHADRNFFEIAYSLERQFGPNGLYKALPLYNFADNHDVNRVASMVRERAHLFSLHCLLFTMPGVPSLYSGSEWGIEGTRTATDDRALRPCLDLERMHREHPSDLVDALRRLMALRRGTDALRHGSYRQLAVTSEQLAFLRQTPGEAVVVAVNAAATEAAMTLRLPEFRQARLVDLLNPPASFQAEAGSAHINVPGCWARVLRVETGGYS
jgi:cyclomaltodextrinase / maltogenic alpha-amylase / neopullulanase